MDTSSDLPAGAILADRYRLDALIGRGAMSTVYRAHDQDLDRPVAVKLLVGAAGSIEALERQTSPTRVGTQVGHPGLVAVYDVRTGEEPPFLVMELVDGTTLSDALACGRLRTDAVAEIGAEVSAALAAMHDAGVVHRAIDPSNVLVGYGEGRTVKLTDFGVSRLAALDRLTPTGRPIGRGRYLSPEQVAGRPADRSTDVYAVGLMLLECLTSEIGFPGAESETLSARLHSDPHVPESLGPEWGTILRAMTAHEPQARPDAAESSEALAGLAAARTRPVADPEPTPDAALTFAAVLPGPVSPAPEPPASAPPAPEPAAPSPLAALAAADVVTPGVTSGSDGVHRDPRNGRGIRRRALLVGVGMFAAVVLFGGALMALQPDSGGSHDDAFKTADSFEAGGQRPGAVGGATQGSRSAVRTGSTNNPSLTTVDGDTSGTPGGPTADGSPSSGDRSHGAVRKGERADHIRTQNPSGPGSSDPTDPGSSDPTDPGSSDPTDPGTTDPTDPGTTDPTDPGTSEPTDPPTSTEPSPTEPTSTSPSDPTTDPSEPTDSPN